MTFTSPETLVSYLVELGTRGGQQQPRTKRLTLFDATWQRHFVAELQGTQLSDSDFPEHLARVFRRPRGGHLVCRLPQHPHVAGRSGRRVEVPDRMAVFTLGNGKAQQLTSREVAIAQGRLTPREAESLGAPPWRKQVRSKPQPQQEAV